MPDFERIRGPYVIATDPARLDRRLIHRFLSEESYWCPGVPYEVVDRSIDNSLNFGMYKESTQVGFARAVTDRATFAYLCDVFVLAPHRERGLGKWLVEVTLEHPDLTGLRRIELGTHDAHGLYEQFGFKPLERVERFMAVERNPEELYGRGRE